MTSIDKALVTLTESAKYLSTEETTALVAFLAGFAAETSSLTSISNSPIPCIFIGTLSGSLFSYVSKYTLGYIPDQLKWLPSAVFITSALWNWCPLKQRPTTGPVTQLAQTGTLKILGNPSSPVGFAS
jgi:hypothetical protein